VDRSLEDEGVLGIGCRTSNSAKGGHPSNILQLDQPDHVQRLREDFVRGCINSIDTRFGRRLGCRMSDKLCAFLNPENHHIGMTRNKKKRLAKEAKLGHKLPGGSTTGA
jgi:hypothetical protein